MTNSTYKLNWHQLEPNTENLIALFKQGQQKHLTEKKGLFVLQSRLKQALQMWCQGKKYFSCLPFMLIKAEDNPLYLSILAEEIKTLLPSKNALHGSVYHIHRDHVSIMPASTKHDNFAATTQCIYKDWVESEHLFGCLRQTNDEYSLHPGIIHAVNGGVLILNINTLLMQPLLWFRLKDMIINRRYQWFSNDDSRVLPLSIPSMPLNVKLILVGDRLALDEFEQLESAIFHQAIYGEFESSLHIRSENEIESWFEYICALATKENLPPLDESMVEPFFKMSTRQTEDQLSLPLSPDWLLNKLSQAACCCVNTIDKQAVQQALQQQINRENYLSELMLNELEFGLVHIDTSSSVVGQINGLSVVQYPGHPRAFGEPSRISCVVFSGDGDIADIEKKAELAGEIHTKGMMIMQAFIASEIALQHPLPFSASIVFEQSYSGVDGDSASLAGLCALISALSLKPLTQQIAVTGSVDQFGNVQAIGGINEKIEGFFALCQRRGLSGLQGVIIPEANIRHLCLNDDVITAVKEQKFSIYAVKHVSQALTLLTGVPYKSENEVSLLTLIQERIIQMGLPDKANRPWFLRWLG